MKIRRVTLIMHGNNKADVVIDRFPGNKGYYIQPSDASMRRVARVVENVPLEDTDGMSMCWKTAKEK